jgi:uncharacterized protein (TIGR02646 family)
MRQLVRPRVKLPTIERIAGGGDEWKSTGVGLPRANLWNNADVRVALYAMHGRACAYCQRHLPGNDRGDVEHFRPQSKYLWLMYSFDNYFLSCSTCNRVRKKSRFPLADRSPQVTYANRHIISDEKILLLNPTDDPVEAWIDFDFDNDIYPIITIEGLERFTRARVEHTIDFFRLNTDVGLLKSRMQIVNQALELLEATENGNEDAKSKLRNLASLYCQHGIVVRRLLEKYKRHLLPTREDDLHGLIDELISELKTIDQIYFSLTPDDSNVRIEIEKFEREICWALAVLWKDPPAAAPEDIEKWIGSSGRLDRVKEYLAELG